jgi:RES domain-containing protein
MVTTEGNRWNTPGIPTIYFAGDPGLALVEGGRHLRDTTEIEPKVVWAARVETDGMLDMTHPEAWATLELTDAYWFLDRDRCRLIATELREQDGVRGLIVPSAGSPDDLSRTNVVLYVDLLPRSLEDVVRQPRVIGRLERTS